MLPNDLDSVDRWCCNGHIFCNIMMLCNGGTKGGFEESLIFYSMCEEIASRSHGGRWRLVSKKMVLSLVSGAVLMV